MATKKQAQIRLDDRILQEPEIEAMLENRQDLKEGATAFRKADKEVKSKLSSLNQPMPFRIGRFIIDRQVRGAKHVEFDSEAGSTLKIKTADE